MNGEKLKKNNLKKIIVCIVIAMVVAITGLVMYSENVHEIGFIENIKQAIEDMINPNSEVDEVNKATVVDVTGITPGDVGNHTCSEYYISKYDETYHWNECKICGKVYDKVSHTFVDNGWTRGSANSCYLDNVHKFICSCGYSYTNTTGRKAHDYSSSYWNCDSNEKLKECQLCHDIVADHHCITADGDPIGCDNLGKCSICGHVWSESDNNHVFLDTGEIGERKCTKCDTKIKILNKEIVTIDSINNIVKFKVSILFPSGTKYNSWPTWLGGTFSSGGYANPSITTEEREDGTVITYETTMKCNEKISVRR